MFMRLVNLHIKPDRLDEFRKLYDKRVIPLFQTVPGCLYASLIHSTQRQEECISLTLWEAPAHAEAYEKGETFKNLLEEIRSYLSDSSEWKVQLTQDLKLEYAPTPEEPVVKAFTVAVETDSGHVAPPTPQMFLRLVSVTVKPDKIEEFTRIYENEIVPILRAVPGCRYASLTESTQKENEFISLTMWDSKRDADEYEQHGAYKDLLQKVKHTMSDLFQWKMQLEKERGAASASSDDLSIERYDIVAGKSFR